MTASMAALLLLDRLHGDEEMAGLFSASATVSAWLRVEAALARAQAASGVLTSDEADAIAAAATLEHIDLDRLWDEARNVGYPILPLVRQLAAALPPGPDGRVHYGATTQDIMDTGLALQLSDALARLDHLVASLGDGLASLVRGHSRTVMAGRTHALQAVPTTFGAKVAVYLAELARHRVRLDQARERVCVVSLHGAGGTSAALGPTAGAVRAEVARTLGLVDTAVPWHVARDGLAEFAWLCAALAGTCGRFAREVIELSRTEVAEVTEAGGHHRGASSTMPQKANPILSEAVIGFAGTAGALSSAMYQAMLAGHERAAGEWQIEWQVLPQLACLSASALRTTASIVDGLQVFEDVMRANLERDNGSIMAEAFMMDLAGSMGRERAHDLVYEAVLVARRDGLTLADALRSVGGDAAVGLSDPEGYLGSTDAVCSAALAAWSTSS